MFYFLAFNSGKVFWVVAKVFVRSFRLDMAVLTLGAVIKGYPIKNIPENDVFVLLLPHVFMQVQVKKLIRKALSELNARK